MGFRVDREFRWPEGKIYYRFAPNPNSSSKSDYEQSREVIVNVMRRYEREVMAKAPKKEKLIEFIEDENEQQGTYILICINTNGEKQGDAGHIALLDSKNSSKKSGEIKFTISPDFLYAVPHELAHSIGLVHENEQNDPDDFKKNPDPKNPRLFYVGNSKSKYKTIATETSVYVRSQRYDRYAITHYPAMSKLSVDKNTLEFKKVSTFAWDDSSFAAVKPKDDSPRKILQSNDESNSTNEDRPVNVSFLSQFVGSLGKEKRTRTNSPNKKASYYQRQRVKFDREFPKEKLDVANGRINYPLASSVVKGTWWLSSLDVDTIIELYTDTPIDGSNSNDKE